MSTLKYATTRLSVHSYISNDRDGKLTDRWYEVTGRTFTGFTGSQV
jgi:hypothetical protein